ncbi:MAG TPA: flagellar export chaperone FliS [Verrucomicrobiae bacterium]
MRQTNLLRSYRQVATQTAPPGQLVLMLFEGAIRFLERAMTGFELEDPIDCNETISNNVIRAQAIIHELNVSLNMEAGGEFSQTMRRLYNYLDYRLMESNLKKEPAGIKESLARLITLRDAWATMLSGQGPAQAVQETPAPVNMAAA